MFLPEVSGSAVAESRSLPYQIEVTDNVRVSTLRLQLFADSNLNGIFESTEHAKAQLTELHARLSREVIDDIAIYKDPSAPKKERTEAYGRVRAIGNILRELGTPPPPEGQEISTQEEYDALPSGSTYTNANTGQKARKP